MADFFEGVDVALGWEVLEFLWCFSFDGVFGGFCFFSCLVRERAFRGVSGSVDNSWAVSKCADLLGLDEWWSESTEWFLLEGGVAKDSSNAVLLTEALVELFGWSSLVLESE